MFLVVTYDCIICWHSPHIFLELCAPFIGRIQVTDLNQFFQQRQQHWVVVWHYKQMHRFQACTGHQIPKRVTQSRLLVAVFNKHLHKGTQHFNYYIICTRSTTVLHFYNNNDNDNSNKLWWWWSCCISSNVMEARKIFYDFFL